MRLVKYDNLYNDALSELDRFFDRAFGGLPGMAGLMPAEPRSFRIDLNQDVDNYYVQAELPGIRKEDVRIELENAVLTISGQRKAQSGEEDSGPETQFSRSITVGDDIVPDKVKAKLDSGILTVTLPKREERKPRTITVS